MPPEPEADDDRGGHEDVDVPHGDFENRGVEGECSQRPPSSLPGKGNEEECGSHA